MDARTLTSSSALTPEEQAGWDAFWQSRPLAEWPQSAAQRGWWMAHRFCYAEGYHAGAIAGDEDTAPYEQFSAAWEAWCDGFNDAPANNHVPTD